VGPHYPVMFRLAADERVEGGFGIEEAVVLCKMLEEAGVDEVDITSGSWGAHEWTDPPMCLPPGCNADLSEAIKKHVKIPVGVAGKINDPYLAERMLKEGKADFVCIGRGWSRILIFQKRPWKGERTTFVSVSRAAGAESFFGQKNLWVAPSIQWQAMRELLTQK